MKKSGAREEIFNKSEFYHEPREDMKNSTTNHTNQHEPR